jgi:hypothetical protein
VIARPVSAAFQRLLRCRRPRRVGLGLTMPGRRTRARLARLGIPASVHRAANTCKYSSQPRILFSRRFDPLYAPPIPKWCHRRRAAVIDDRLESRALLLSICRPTHWAERNEAGAHTREGAADDQVHPADIPRTADRAVRNAVGGLIPCPLRSISTDIPGA